MHGLILLSVALKLVTSLGTLQVEQHVEKLRAAARTGSYENLRPLFSNAWYTRYLESMVGPAQELRYIGVSAFPAPPGFENLGEQWVVFHRYQRVEHHHDAVFPIIRTGDGVTLGAELPEDLFVPYRFEELAFDVKLHPAEGRAAFHTTCRLKRISDGPKTVLMRMNDAYVVTSVKYDGKTVAVQTGKDIGDFRLDSKEPRLAQAGGVLFLTNAGDGGRLELNYEASLNIRGLDKTTDKMTLLTSYWYPHIGREPVKTRTRIEGPKEWLLLGQGDKISEREEGDRKIVEYRNDVAVPFHHIVAGSYTLAFETESRGRKFRAWHLDGVDEKRGKHDAETARDSVAFFEDRFGKFPYNHYDVVDTPDFYGIECYSFTVLTPRITSWATSHEVGHTWFGGIVPNSYIRSIWNESMTQYVDSVQFKNNSDNVLKSGYDLRGVNVTLATTMLAHGPTGNVGYFRGAFTLKMLENELGLDLMNRCLRELVKQRQGKTTEWTDVEKLFSETAARPLGWFFDQWVRNGTFPKISFGPIWVEAGPRGGFNTSVRLSQSGTSSPFRLRFEVRLTTGSGFERFPVLMEEPVQQFNLESAEKPTRVEINPLGWTLADVPNAVKL